MKIFFVLNKAENLCNECHGLGYIRTLDKNKVINYDIPLKKILLNVGGDIKTFIPK